jgi:hypothetical protein
MRLRWRLLLAAVLAVTFGAVTAWALRPTGRETHADGDGPLSASSGVGGNVLAQRHGTRYIGFGSFMLCVEEPGTTARVERVGYDDRVAPRRLDVLLRTVTPDDVATGTRRRLTMVGSDGGRRPDFLQRRYTGSYTTRVRGLEVSQPCQDRRDRPVKGVPANGFQELMFVMSVDRRGAWVPRTWVDYTVDGRPYRLMMRWEMGVCGAVSRRLMEDC